MNEDEKKEIKELAKIALYCINNRQEKPYEYWLRKILKFYLVRKNLMGTMQEMDEKIDNCLRVIQRTGLVGYGRNFYGTYLTAKKKLPKSEYSEFDINILNDGMKLDIKELELFLAELNPEIEPNI